MANANPLIQGIQVTPRGIPTARFISQDEVNAYQERVKTTYADNQRALNSLLADVQGAKRVLRINPQTGEPEHSNFFAVAELQAMGVPVASAETLDILAGSNSDALRGHYEDLPSLVLRSATDEFYSTNNRLIKDLLPHVRKRLTAKEKKHPFPVLITRGLKTKAAQNEYYLYIKINRSNRS